MCRPKDEEVWSLAQAVVETRGSDPKRDRGMVESTLSELEEIRPKAHHDLAEALREEGAAHRVSLGQQPLSTQSSSFFSSPERSTLGMIFPEDQDQ